MVRVTMLSAQNNTASNYRLISARVTGNHVERSRFGLVQPLNAELNPMCHLLTLLGAHYILHVSRVRVEAVI